MEPLSTRALTSQLADDLAWLEKHAHQQGNQGRAAVLLRLAAGLVRNIIGPYLDGQEASPLHVVVVGGAGAGKSTVSNLLAGTVVAESNAQAGFTRHPIAYTTVTGPLSWAAHLGFLGPLTRLTQPGPSSLDQDVYQVRRVHGDPNGTELMRDWVIWDCPDMTTWAAEGYIPRLVEAAALADVVVYAASDERYNDEVPTQFLRMLLQAGKPVVVCLMKMREEDAPTLVAHFKKAVLGGLPGGLAKGVMEVLPIPYLSSQQLTDPIREAGRWRIPLLNQVAVLGGDAAAGRKRTVLGATRFLTAHQKDLLEVAHQDVQALEIWKSLVQAGQAEFDSRYNREYLTSEKFRGFDDALVQLMKLLELPGIGQVISGALYVLRTPYRLLSSFVSQAMSRPEAPTRPEQQTLEDALEAWIDMLHKECARRSEEHELWHHLSQGFHATGLAERTKEQFKEVYRGFQASLNQEVHRTAESIYKRLEERPFTLNALRGGKLAIDAAAIGGTAWAGGLSPIDLLLVPLAASLTHQLVELFGKQYVDDEREKTRGRQQQLLHRDLSTPLAQWLVSWPTTGGSAFERLQLALNRLPGGVAALTERVTQATR